MKDTTINSECQEIVYYIGNIIIIFALNKIVKMTWSCPLCKRTFRSTNQSHSCVVKNIDDHFIGKNINVRATYDVLESKLKSIFDFSIHPVLNAIMFTTDATFLAIKPKKSWIDLEFILSNEVNEFPIHKVAKASKTRYAHFVRIQEPKEIDEQLIGWIKEAYKLNLNKN